MPSMAHPALGTSRSVRCFRHRRTPVQKTSPSCMPSRDSGSLVQSCFSPSVTSGISSDSLCERNFSRVPSRDSGSLVQQPPRGDCRASLAMTVTAALPLLILLLLKNPFPPTYPLATPATLVQNSLVQSISPSTLPLLPLLLFNLIL